MALNPKYSNTAANAAADALCALANSGYFRVYEAPQPANADTALAGQKLLAELRFGAAVFGAAIAGVATAAAMVADTNADDTGTAAWFRVLKSDGVTVVFDGTVGVNAGFDWNMVNTASIVAGAKVEVTGLTYTQSKG